MASVVRVVHSGSSGARASSLVLAAGVCALLAVIWAALWSPSIAQAAPPPRQPGAGELRRAIDRLGVVGSVLYVAAHPDDENTRLLAYLANDKLLRTAYLSITRGDGGQNLIGAEQGPLLGLIRTEELLAARRVDGAEQFFTRARDFGYSKTPEETLAIWGKDEVLADVVWVIRSFKPDVIITRFPSKGGQTHGHHTASAILAEAAFRAAADPAFRPDQVKQVGTWQAKRLLWNKFLSDGAPADDRPALKLDVGGYSALLGLSYGEMAAESRSMHKSQGFGAARSRGTLFEYFEPVAGDRPSRTVFDQLDLTWGRVKKSGKLAQLLRRAAAQFRPDRPEASLPLLLEAYAELGALSSNPWKEQKRRELSLAIQACAGLFTEAYASDFAAVPGGDVALTAVALNRSDAALTLRAIRLPNGVVVPVNQPLVRDTPIQINRTIKLPERQPYSDPYWLEEPPLRGRFAVRDQRLIGLPDTPAALRVELDISVDGGRRGGVRGEHTLTVTRPVLYKWTDPVAGERYRGVEIVPPVMLNPEPTVLMFPDGGARQLRIVVKSSIAAATGRVRLELPAGWKAEPPARQFQLSDKGAEEELDFRIRPPPRGRATATLRMVAELGGKTLSRSVVRIEHPHIPIQTLLPRAEVKLVRFDFAKAGATIGYIAGAGDEVAPALRQVGYEVTMLDDEALRTQRLGRFNAILVGVRAYNTNARLPLVRKKLMDYVAAGGTLVVQYSTNNRISKAPLEIGPYPFEISQDRVTDETAAVGFDAPEHTLVKWPNRITAADFGGWVQERGLYFAGQWSDQYRTIFSMNDPGETPKKGSVLVARHGKGAFVYTGLAFFRQLPAGVPGAYRLLANMIAYGRRPD